MNAEAARILLRHVGLDQALPRSADVEIWAADSKEIGVNRIDVGAVESAGAEGGGYDL